MLYMVDIEEIEKGEMEMKKTIFVIGAGKGLGNGVAEKFAAEGFCIVLMARNESSLQVYASDFATKGYEVHTEAVDVTDFAVFADTFRKVTAAYGVPDVLFYNVGITAPDDKETLNADTLMEHYRADVAGAYHAIKLVVTEDFAAKKGSDKVIFFQKRDTTHATNQLPTHIERVARNNPDDITLKELVAEGIGCLDNEKGFFMMAEGSMIDWAAHSNDLPGLIFETLDMSDAIEVAMEFYRKHPENTLIVVTADHETGGPACNKPRLYKISNSAAPADDTNVDNYMSGENNKANLSEEAGIGWTAGTHTADRVPVYAIGTGSEKFAGEMDNTDIPRKICEAMGIDF